MILAGTRVDAPGNGNLATPDYAEFPSEINSGLKLKHFVCMSFFVKILTGSCLCCVLSIVLFCDGTFGDLKVKRN